MKNEPVGDIINKNNNSGVKKNADIGEYDSFRETQLREDEEKRLHGRGNQANSVGNQSSTARTQRKSLQSDWGEHIKEQPQNGIIDKIFKKVTSIDVTFFVVVILFQNFIGKSHKLCCAILI